MPRDAFCSSCGTAFLAPLVYPRTCPGCRVTSWSNPTPVCVALVPVKHREGLGLLVVRRGIPPGLGRLALTGGFLESHESWQQGAAREVREETGVVIDPAGLAPFWFTSTTPRPNQVLLFSLAAELDAASMPPFTPVEESQARGLVFGAEGLEESFAFGLHVEAVRRYFSSRGTPGPHRYLEA